MSTNGRSRGSFLVNSVAGLNVAWVAGNYPGILAAQYYVRQATQAGSDPKNQPGRSQSAQTYPP